MKQRTRDDHLFGPGPKRILALDGGGIRGLLTLGYLGRIEDILRDRCGGDPEFRLCDYFDLIGGTSTGAIIAAGLALGFTVDELQGLYLTMAREVFQRSVWRLGILTPKFSKESLMAAMDRAFGPVTLGSDKLRTGLAVMTKRLDTGSPWVIHNNPRGKFFGPVPGETESVPNRDFLLSQVVRASSAAPTYFEPEELEVARGCAAAFVDGGVSTFQNPALQLLMLATIRGYGFCWPTGPENLLLVSVGTGTPDFRMPAGDVMKMPAVQIVGQSLLSLMNDCDWLGQTILQWMSDSPTAWEIDSEIGDLQGEAVSGREMLSYLRYNVLFDREWLDRRLGVKLDQRQIKALSEIDNVKNLELLELLGQKAAGLQVEPGHFPKTFDPEGWDT